MPPYSSRGRFKEPGNPSTDTNSRGAGLGLSIVKSIAQIHSAQVELGESDLGGLSIKIGFDLG